MPKPLQTRFSQILGISYPIIAAPMFLVSDEKLVAAASNGGAIGVTPSLNWRTSEGFRAAIQGIKKATQKPFGVNLIVNKSNIRQDADLAICVEEKVPFLITSLGNPKDVIKAMHAIGAKVFCDVTNLEYAQKVQDLGADGVIAVSSGAGGHAGPTSPLVLLPYLKKHLSIPIVAAGGIVNGQQMAAALLLGASAVQIGTRFIASTEAKVDQSYKDAILKSDPDDIVLTSKISGTPVSVINTSYIQRVGLELSTLERYLMKHPSTKKYMKLARSLLGAHVLEKAASGTTWKEVWCAGQGVGLIDEILPAANIIENLMSEYYASKIPD